jgi:hypothetical protein
LINYIGNFAASSRLTIDIGVDGSAEFDRSRDREDGAGLPDFSWHKIPMREKIYQMTIKHMYQMAVKLTQLLQIIPNGRKIYQSLPLQDPTKYTLIGIFGLKICIPSGNPEAVKVRQRQQRQEQARRGERNMRVRKKTKRDPKKALKSKMNCCERNPSFQPEVVCRKTGQRTSQFLVGWAKKGRISFLILLMKIWEISFCFW